MADVSKALEKMAAGPWRAALVAVGAAFLVATVASTIIGHVFVRSDVKSVSAAGRAPAARATASGFNAPSPVASLNQSQIDGILKRNIFNSEGAADETEAKKAEGEAPKTAEAVKSDLPVKLVGTIYGGDPYSGIALVENDQKKTINSFMCGDTLLKDATVKEIHKERIIIDRNGRLEYIEVVREGLSRSRRNKKKAAVASSDAYTPIATDPPPASFKEEGFERKGREIAMTQAYRSKLLTTDFTKVLQDAKATPNMVNGELQGFVLTRIRKDSIYEKAGLQNDDIVSEINGVPLTDVSQAIKLLQSLRNEPDIEIRVMRGGSPLRFTLTDH